MTKKVAVIGDWHLAFVTASVLADAGHAVSLVKPLNLNPSQWSEFPPIPVTEPGLQDMIDRNRSAKRLSHINGLHEDLTVDFLWLAVDTPVNDLDEPQLEPLVFIAKQIAKLKHRPKALIVSSQIPLGFCKELETITGLTVAYIPENLRLGQGIETFHRADRTVIGCDSSSVAADVQNLLSSFPTEFVLCNSVTAEMVKHANNAFLATSISFANELARIGEKYGVDSVTVGKALKLDKRIGKAAYVIPGLGFAGGTLPRDLRVIQKIGKKENVPTQIIDAVLQVNENTTKAISEIVKDHVQKNSLPKRILVLGYTYKADTNTLRRSLSLDIADDLQRAGFEVLGFDPVMNDQDLSGLAGKIKHLNKLSDLAAEPSVILLMTSRPQFSTLNWSDLRRSPKTLVLDTQNYLKADSVLPANLIFKRLWSPVQTKVNA
jgi:UDPglucose 6-dehydrogenase